MTSRKMRNEAIYDLAVITDRVPNPNESKDWNLAEIKKYSTVREYIDKSNGTEYIYTTYGTMHGKTDYYGLKASTREVLSGEEAKDIYMKSNTWYK